MVIVIAWSCICIFCVTFSFISFVFYHILANFKLKKGRDHLSFLNPGDLVSSLVPDICYYFYQKSNINQLWIMCQTLFKSALHKSSLFNLHSNYRTRNFYYSHLIDEETEIWRSRVVYHLTVRMWQSWDLYPAKMAPKSAPIIKYLLDKSMKHAKYWGTLGLRAGQTCI